MWSRSSARAWAHSGETTKERREKARGQVRDRTHGGRLNSIPECRWEGLKGSRMMPPQHVDEKRQCLKEIPVAWPELPDLRER